MSPIIARLIGWGAAAVLTCFMLLLILMPTPAKATGSKPSQPTSSSTAVAASASANAQANGAGYGYGGSGHATGGTSTISGVAGYGGASSTGDFYVLPAPVSGVSLPAGMCQRSRYEHFSIGWNFVSSAKGDSHTDMDCLNAILAVQKARHEAANPPRLLPPTACERAAHKASVAKKKPKVCA